MHELNHSGCITHDFFDAPNNSKPVKLTHLYNKLFGTIPTTISFSERFELSAKEAILEHFELFVSDLVHRNGKLYEEAVYIGKRMTAYTQIILNVQYHTNAAGQVTQTSMLHPFTSPGFDFNEGVLELPPLSLEEEVEDNEKLMQTTISLRAACQCREQAEQLVKLFTPYKTAEKSKIYILTNNYGDLEFSPLPLDIKPTDLALNYGDTFPAFHEKLIRSLNEQTSGLYLFYGASGTGKSSYIKHLLCGEIKRKIAYIPVSLIDRLVSPDMLPLLMANKNMILVIEDAEKALLSRESDEGNSALVSSILNLTDGFIGQALNISLIGTFNTARERIEEALLRRGRLRMSHEFHKLSYEEAKKLAVTLGIAESEIEDGMTLADIYYIHDETGYEAPKEKKMGFGG